MLFVSPGVQRRAARRPEARGPALAVVEWNANMAKLGIDGEKLWTLPESDLAHKVAAKQAATVSRFTVEETAHAALKNRGENPLRFNLGNRYSGESFSSRSRRGSVRIRPRGRCCLADVPAGARTSSMVRPAAHFRRDRRHAWGLGRLRPRRLAGFGVNVAGGENRD